MSEPSDIGQAGVGVNAESMSFLENVVCGHSVGRVRDYVPGERCWT